MTSCFSYSSTSLPLTIFHSGAFDLWDQTCNEHHASDELSQQQRQRPAPVLGGQTWARPSRRGPAHATGRGRPAIVREEEAPDSPEAPEEEQRTLYDWHEWPRDQCIASCWSLMSCTDQSVGEQDTFTGRRTVRPSSSSPSKMCWCHNVELSKALRKDTAVTLFL